MVATRTGQHSHQQALEDMPGVDVTRRSGGSKAADEQPQRPLKRTKAGGRSGKKAAAAAEARKSEAQEQEHETAADDARAAVAAVDTGAQEQLRKNTKQTGLKADSGDDGGGSSGGKSHDDKGHSGAAKDVKLDKSDHGNAKPAGDKRGGASKRSETRAAKEEAQQHPGKVVKINRAPVLTLWVKTVAEREGYDEDAALTFGKAISAMLAQAKGRRLGIFEEKDHEQQEPGKPQVDRAEVFGMKLKVVRDGDAVRATEGGDQAMDPGKVRGYLKRAFGEDLNNVEAAMAKLAAAYGKDDISGNAYRLYENFRPTVSDGTRGWGAKADLDLGLLRALAHQHQQGS